MPSTIKNRIIFDADIGDTEANEDNSSTYNIFQRRINFSEEIQV